ncbi:hypothetical protein [Roseivirga seohaensis]|uniref:hypothetical protein n=1 Tax=Roseivirga seohaensis TaxID=1914963 RepID=UPI003BAAE312
MSAIKNELFHPLRYQKSRAYSAKLFRKYSNHNPYSEEGLNDQMDDFIQIVRKEFSKYPIPQRKALIANHIGNTSDILKQEHSLFVELKRFKHRGANIFYFPEHVCQLFKKTDVSEISIGNINLPYKSFYIAFGPQQEFDLGTDQNLNHFFDGAYIEQVNDTILSIRLTSKSSKNSDIPNWFTDPEFTFWLGLEFERLDEKLVTAVERFVKDSRRRFEEWENTPKTVEVDGVEIDTNPIPNEHPDRQKRLKRIVDKSALFIDIANLLFNAICYLTWPDNELSTEFTNSPSKSRLDRLKRTKKPQERKKQEIELHKNGFTKVTICGKSIHSEKEEGLHSMGELSTHWRRGHWRNQTYGSKGNEQVKLIWIKPTLVRADKGSPSKGHIYELKNADKKHYYP